MLMAELAEWGEGGREGGRGTGHRVDLYPGPFVVVRRTPCVEDGFPCHDLDLGPCFMQNRGVRYG
jgi:hypothetical protein